MFGIRGTDAVLQALREAEDHKRPSQVEARSLPVGLLLSKTLDLNIVPAATYTSGVDVSTVSRAHSTAWSFSEVAPVAGAIEGPVITLPGICGLASEVWSTWDRPLNERIKDYLTEHVVRVGSSFVDPPRLWSQSGDHNAEDAVALFDGVLERYWLALWRLHRLGCMLRRMRWLFYLNIERPQ